MNIPENTTEEETMRVMEKVINKTAAKYTFYGYSVDDIKQESYIICIEALERYDGVRPLENFLSVNLSNRLKNFVRDNYFLSNTDPDRVKVIQPAQLDYEEKLVDEHEKYSVNDEEVDNSYLLSNIDRLLPASMRLDYLKILDNVYVNKTRKDEVNDKILEIMQEIGYEEG